MTEPPAVLVSGASGYLGTLALRELRRRGCAPVALVNTRPLGGEFDGVTTVPVPQVLGDAPPAMPPVLLHLAWGGLPNYGSMHHLREELPAQLRLVEGALRAGVRRVVVAGTCYEYGLKHGPLAPSDAATPCTPYGAAKAMLHEQLRYLTRERPFSLAWARLFYLFGDDQPRGSLYASLRQAALRGDTEFPMSGGEQLRDFLPAAEVARLLVELALSPDEGPVNLCSGRPVSVRGQVETWIEQHGWTIRPRLGALPYSPHEPMAAWGIPWTRPRERT